MGHQLMAVLQIRQVLIHAWASIVIDYAGLSGVLDLILSNLLLNCFCAFNT